jgi:hypothetical protein
MGHRIYPSTIWLPRRRVIANFGAAGQRRAAAQIEQGLGDNMYKLRSRKLTKVSKPLNLSPPIECGEA